MGSGGCGISNKTRIGGRIMDFEVKHKIGDLVKIKTTDTVGTVISIHIHLCDTGYSVVYEVAHPNCNNDADAKTFYGVELEKIESDKKFGF